MNPEQIYAVATHLSVAGPKHVLIVDDHAPTLAAVAAMFEREYPRIEVVGTASDGEMALEIIREASPDVVVLDLDLGNEYGLDLMPAIREYKNISVIILSCSDDPVERDRALAAGAVAFVSKFSPAEELIAAALAARAGSIGVGDLSRENVTLLPGKQVEASDSSVRNRGLDL